MNNQRLKKLIKEEIQVELKNEPHHLLFYGEENDFSHSFKVAETDCSVLPTKICREKKTFDFELCNKSSPSEKYNFNTKYTSLKDSHSELVKDVNKEDFDMYEDDEFLTDSYSYKDSLDTPLKNDKLIYFKLIEKGDNKSDIRNPFIKSMFPSNACSDPESKGSILDKLMQNEYDRSSKLEIEESPHLQLIEVKDKIECDMHYPFTESKSHIFNDYSKVNKLSHFDKLMKDEYDQIANLDDELPLLQDSLKVEYEKMLKEEYEHWAKLENQKSPLLHGDVATTFLIKRRLLAKNKIIECHKCGSGVKYCTMAQKGVRRGVMRCKNRDCQTTQSLRKTKSFWASIDQYGRYISKLSISAQLELVFYWCKNVSTSDIVTITAESFRTVSNFMKRCQQVPLRMFKNRTQLGGSGKVVYVNYRQLPQFKKHIGGHFYGQTESSLLFVVCNDNEERYFFLKKYDTTALHKIVKQEVAVGTTILSDKLMECHVLLKFGYNYHTMIHDKNVNNSMVDAFILRMENVWKPLMLLYECEHGINQNLSPSSLIEIWWRSLNKSDPFNAFLRDVAEVF